MDFFYIYILVIFYTNIKVNFVVRRGLPLFLPSNIYSPSSVATHRNLCICATPFWENNIPYSLVEGHMLRYM